jgi:threonine/homoserine/homoserine lactone efflux protein
MARERDTELARKGRMAAMVIAGTGVFWIAATLLGSQLGLTQRTRALFDLMALAGFVWAVWMIYQIWRLRQSDRG